MATFMTMMVIALWHGFTVSMFIYGIVHATVLMAIEFRYMKFPESKPPGNLRIAFTTLATFLFVAATAPLLVLGVEDIAPFYRLLLMGVAP